MVKGKGISIVIFLVSIFVLLAIVTGAWMYNLYTSQTRFSDTETKSIIECNSYVFGVENMVYNEPELEFIISGKIGPEINKITIESGSDIRTINFSGLSSGAEQAVSVNLSIQDSVLIYPTGCKEQNSKTFKVR